MRGYYKPKYFDVREFVDKETYTKFGENSLMFLDNRLLKTIDGIREYINAPITINNWHNGGNYDSRGLRRPSDKTGAEFSQHRFGRALDFTVKDKTAEEVRQVILAHQGEEPFNEICAVEADVTWVHIDMRNVNSNNIFVFKG